jgi:hypothetical protein
VQEGCLSSSRGSEMVGREREGSSSRSRSRNLALMPQILHATEHLQQLIVLDGSPFLNCALGSTGGLRGLEAVRDRAREGDLLIQAERVRGFEAT